MRHGCADELVDAWVHRPLAGLLVRGLARTPVAPDHLTLLSCGTGLCAALYLALGHPAAAPLIVTSLVFDCADGQLARLRGPSKYGRWLDGVSDDVVGVALYLALLAQGIPLPVAAAAGVSLLLRGVVFDGLKAVHRGAADIPVYTPIQKRLVGRGPVSCRFLTLAGLAGPSTHHVILAVSILAGRFDVFVLYAVVAANLWLAALLGRRHAVALDLAPEGK